MPETPPTEKLPIRRFLIATLIVSLPWLAFSLRYALRSGGDCDVWRQWTVSQYVQEGVNPYGVALDILKLNFGSMHGPDRLRLGEFVIYEVHPRFRTDGVTNFLSNVGPPTATYPPSSLLPIAWTVGRLPPRAVHPVWLLVNLALLAALARAFSRDFDLGLLFAFALLLIWPPTQEVFRTLQFVFVATVATLAGVRHLDSRPARAGLWFAFALIKPSVALPFLVLPLARGRWKTIAVAGGLHLAALGIMWTLLKTPPWIMLGQWMEISRYMLQGAYSLQEITNRLGFDNSPVGTAIMLLFAAACAAWCAVHRRANRYDLLAFLCFASVLWTYHERYDFFVLLIPLAWALRTGTRPATLALFVVLGVALTDPVYSTDHPAAWALRWAGRLSLYALTALFAARLRAAHQASASGISTV